ncbi:hypothetical protein ACWEIK_17075 [Streptomyces sp. NPDC004673]
MAVEKRRNEIERDVEIRIRQARYRFEDRFAGLPDEAMKKLLQETIPLFGRLLGAISIKSGDDLVALIGSTPCPACKGQAQVRMAHIKSSPTTGELIPQSLQCSMCALKLDSPEEVEVIGTRAIVTGTPTSAPFSWNKNPPGFDIKETHIG